MDWQYLCFPFQSEEGNRWPQGIVKITMQGRRPGRSPPFLINGLAGLRAYGDTVGTNKILTFLVNDFNNYAL